MASETVENKFIQIDKWGFPLQPGVLSTQTERLVLSHIEDNDIVVKMKYACLHPADVIMAMKYFPESYNAQHDILPSKIGLEGLGEVIKVGSKVKKFKVGDRIFPDNGGQPQQFQTYLIVKDGIQIPNNLSDEIAVQSTVNPYAALGLLDEFNLIEGRPQGWLVQDAANSTVGRLIHSLAREKGIKTVALVRKEDAIDTVKSLGATKVIVTGSFKNADDYTKAIMDATGGQGAKYGIDCIGAEIAVGIFNAMQKNGKLLNFGALSGKMFSSEGLPNPNNVSAQFYSGYTYWEKPKEHTQPQIDYFFKLYSSRKLDLPVEKVFKFEDYIDAFKF